MAERLRVQSIVLISRIETVELTRSENETSFDPTMPLNPTYRLLTLLVLAALCSGPLAAARGMLHLDGILSIRGDRSSSARVIILPTGGMPTAMENVSGQFKLSLPLDGTYLLSFEREGLVTKQVYFDTSVPVERHSEAMTFPFKVTLFPEGKDNIYAYAGPVGIVRYYVAEKDFSYITDYTLKEGAPMSKRIRDLQQRMEERGPDGLPLNHGEVNYTVVRVNGVDVATGNAGSTQSSTVEMDKAPIPAPAEAIASAGAAMDPLEMATTEVDAGPVSVELIDPLATALQTKNLLASNRSVGTNKGTGQSVRRRTLPPPVDLSDLPKEELIVERQRVTTVVRITEGTGHITEYRRVVDRHGAVVHFRDGVAIPEHVFREATGR
jgi:hypothetical protein